MKISSISDVHIKKKDDAAYRLLISFLEHEKVLASDYIFLLGDIFDLMVGGHKEYLQEYQVIFNKIDNLLKAGKQVIYIEGNHDFHNQSLWNMFNEKRDQKVLYQDSYFIMNKESILFCHGDDIQDDNRSYSIYRYLIRSRFIKWLSSVVPYSFVKKIGEGASQKSRERNHERYNSKEAIGSINLKFKNFAKKIANKTNTKIIVCGHSHSLDHFTEDGIEYINNGYVPVTQKFVHIDLDQNKQISHVSITST